MATTKRFENFDGVSIKVICKSWGYSVLIQIEEGAYLWHERKNENCAIKFIVPYHKRIAQKSYKIKINKQGYNYSKLGTPFRRNFDLPSGGTCLLYLSPQFFLPDELVNQCQDDSQEIAIKQTKTQTLLFAPLKKKPMQKAERPMHYDHSLI